MLIKDTDNSRQSGLLPQDFFIEFGTVGAIVKKREDLALIVDEPCLRACEYLYDCNILTTGSSANGSHSVKYGEITISYSSLSDENKGVYRRLVSQGIAQRADLDGPELWEPFDENDGVKRSDDFHTDLDESEQWESFNKKYGIKRSDDFHIRLPMDETTTVEEFSQRMEEVVRQFKPQDIFYGNFTPIQIYEMMLQNLSKGGSIYQIINERMWKEVEKGNISTYEQGNWDIEQTATIYNGFALGYYYDPKEGKYWLHESLHQKHLDFIGRSFG